MAIERRGTTQMRPGAIKRLVKWSPDLGQDQSMRSLWREKEASARERGLHESIAEHGVQEPITIATEYSGRDPVHWLTAGHHRVAAAHAVERETGRKIHIPVEFED